ncbi:uncharacterized protein LOC124359140 [Homalodisca vitripennis]|uniref:Uncharacterized protein n=1 Tax=Homalodisca liturata TaxID=320908 RepID=A0A1B6H8C7_9HEMI|nr:uncharacterized protein LOC124359140 [Homalodisca vitripennis]KAG8249954.1 hypothetical protein J6590_009082 [Homalodisca vitripennis]
MAAESGELPSISEDIEDYNEGLRELKNLIGEASELVEEIDTNFLDIFEKDRRVLEEIDVKESALNYILLEQSKHRDLIEGVRKIFEYCNQLEEFKAAHDAQSEPRLKAALQEAKLAFRNANRLLQELEKSVAQHQSIYKTSRSVLTSVNDSFSL